MTTIEKVGKTVEEAVVAALSELGVVREQVTFEVLEEPSKGFLGFIGGKPARVKVTVKDIIKEEVVCDVVKTDASTVAEEFLSSVLEKMHMNVKIDKAVEGDSVILNIRGADLGILIGKFGQTLDALQYLTNLAAHRDSEDRVRIVVDVEDYRKRRVDTLTRLAKRSAERVIANGEKVSLEPMSPHERKVIHLTLQDDRRVTTHSDGEEPFRRVIISLKK